MDLSIINETFPTFYNTDFSMNDLFDEKDTSFSIPLAMPLWELLVTVATLGIIIIITIVGNVLVILSIFNYRPLRIVQNFFLVSLAVADLTVAVFVLPFNVAYSVTGKWIFGIHMCQMWLTCDILCCTASILSLCAIALDRYWAITDPINYAQKRTVKRVIIMIALVWIISVIICLPPLFGWNDWPEEFNMDTPCKLTQDKGFVIYSSMGSFYVPLLIMTIVYIKIFFATRKRLRERAKASKINQMKTGKTKIRQDEDSVMSDTHDHNGLSEANKKSLLKVKRKKKKKDTKLNGKDDQQTLAPPPANEESTTDNDIPPREGSQKQVRHSDVVVEITPGSDNQIHQFIREKQKISLSKERRAARTLGIIMGVFVVCWLPFFLFYVIVPYCSPTCPVPDNKVVSFITWLGYINSSLNPVIYTIFNLDFRKAFAKYLRCPSSTKSR